MHLACVLPRSVSCLRCLPALASCVAYFWQTPQAFHSLRCVCFPMAFFDLGHVAASMHTCRNASHVGPASTKLSGAVSAPFPKKKALVLSVTRLLSQMLFSARCCLSREQLARPAGARYLWMKASTLAKTITQISLSRSMRHARLHP